LRQTLARTLRPLGRLGSRTVTAGTVLFGVLTTAVVYAFCADLLERDGRLRFENDTGDVVQQIDTRIRLYTDVLVTMQALFGASDHVSRSEFRDFVSGLNLPQRYPGFQTLNYAPYVPAGEIEAFVEKQRADPVLREAGVTFSVRPPGKRPGHYVLTYVEPLDINLASVGIDMGAEPRRLAALERARDSGQSVSSGRLIFSEAKNPHVGIALQTLHVIFADLDEFKVINDTIGHNAGDTVLRVMADCLRENLNDAELITRFGGYEFVVLLDPKGDPTILGRTISRIQPALTPGFVVNQSELRMMASIGISSFPEDGNEWQTLLKHADLAMYGAKQLGKNGYQFYCRDMRTSLQRRIDMESHLHRALEQNEFVPSSMRCGKPACQPTCSSWS